MQTLARDGKMMPAVSAIKTDTFTPSGVSGGYRKDLTRHKM